MHDEENRHLSYGVMRDAGLKRDCKTVLKTTTSVRVKVTPGASRELVREIENENINGGTDKKHSQILKNLRMFEIYVREPAQKNMANRRVCELIAREYGAPPSAARIESGHRSRNKIIRITM